MEEISSGTPISRIRTVKFRRPSPQAKRVAYISTYPPRICGIATFTKDLTNSIDQLGIFRRSKIIAINNGLIHGEYPKNVIFQIEQKDLDSYGKAAQFLNNSNIDLISVQFEYGIYGGKDGEYILHLLRASKKPVVTTLHTILSQPNPQQIKVLKEVGQRSKKVVIMARNVIPFLEGIYKIPKEKISFIPHGVPDVPFYGNIFFKRLFGLEDRQVISTFGLIEHGKGVEYTIKAIKETVPSNPDIIFLIIGRTHPQIKKMFGEAYRRKLENLVREYKLTRSIKFVNRFLPLQELITYLRATNIYVASQVDPQQYVSGTLAYALGCGKAIISTPFSYAQETIGDRRGILVKFKDHLSIAKALKELLSNPDKKRQIEESAYVFSREMTWSFVAIQYVDLLRSMIYEHREYEKNR